MRDVLRVLSQVPLQVTGEARSVIEDAEQHRLSAHSPRAVRILREPK